MSQGKDVVRAFRVGIVVLSSLALLIAAIFLLGQNTRVWSKKVDYRIDFSNVQGLAAGSIVSVAGYRIGTVKELVLPRDITEGLVQIHIAVEKANHHYI